MFPSPISDGRIVANDLEFAFLEAGDPRAPLVLCLHGFPDCAAGWIPLLTDLAAAGYHAVAPNMAGYAPTAVPHGGLAPIGRWVRDANALHEHFAGDEHAVLIGHDWGAMATYGAAVDAPGNWRAIVTASLPPTSIIASRLLDYDQLKMFWYQYVFLQPTAEVIVAHEDLEFIARLWADWSPGFDASDALGPVKAALRDPDHLTAALSTYRTTYDMSLIADDLIPHQLATMSPHSQRTLYLHGANDGCISAALVDPTREILPAGSEAVVVAGAGHFLQYEQPVIVSALILDFLAS